MNKILGLDISTKSTGVSIFDGEKLVYSETISATSANVFNRINKITKRIEELVKQYQPTKVAVEDPEPAFVNNNREVYRKLTWAQGIIAQMLDGYGLTMEFTTASHWRKLVGITTGRGVKRGSLKPKDMAKAKEIFGKDYNDDEADAILIGLAYALEHKGKIEWGAE